MHSSQVKCRWETNTCKWWVWWVYLKSDLNILAFEQFSSCSLLFNQSLWQSMTSIKILVQVFCKNQSYLKNWLHKNRKRHFNPKLTIIVVLNSCKIESKKRDWKSKVLSSKSFFLQKLAVFNTCSTIQNWQVVKLSLPCFN